MTALFSLKNILNKLKKEEIKLLINFINLNKKEEKSKKLKTIKFIELLLSNSAYSVTELQILLYGKINYTAFNKLIRRLKDKIYEILLFDNSLQKSVSAKRNLTIFNVKKKLIQSEIMFARGINDELEIFQNKIIKTAKQYEIYDSLIEALQAKQRYLGFRFGSIASKKIKEEIIFYEKSRTASHKAREIFNSLTSKINFSATSEEYQKELEDSIRILGSDYRKTKSSIIGYYYLFLRIEKDQNANNLLSAKINLLKLKKHLDNHRSVYTDNRMGTTLINIAINELMMFNFEFSIDMIHMAIKYFSTIAVNIQFAQEIEFHSLFYSGHLDKAELLINELYNASRNSGTPFIFSKRAYLLACVKTLKGEYKNSQDLLSEVREIEKDKEGWNLGKRIISIINKIEVQDYDPVELNVLNLQKHIKRTLKTKHVRKRDILILRILLRLINDQFNFKNVYKSRKRYFDLLESNKPEYKWKIKSPELIMFHEWFKCKANNQPYNHTIALSKENEKYLSCN